MSTPKRKGRVVARPGMVVSERGDIGMGTPLPFGSRVLVLPADAASVERMGSQLRAAFDLWMCEDETEWDSFGACMLAAIGITAKGGRK